MHEYICVAQGWFKTIYLWYLCTGCSPSITELVEIHLIIFIEDIDLFWSAEDGHTVWSDLQTWSFISEKHPDNNKIYHFTPHNVLIISEIDNIQYEIMNSLSTHSIRKYLPEDQHTVHYQINVYPLKPSCVVYFRIWHMSIYSLKKDLWHHWQHNVMTSS